LFQFGFLSLNAASFVVLLPAPFRGMRAQKNFTETQQSSHAPNVWTRDQKMEEVLPKMARQESIYILRMWQLVHQKEAALVAVSASKDDTTNLHRFEVEGI